MVYDLVLVTISFCTCVLARLWKSIKYRASLARVLEQAWEVCPGTPPGWIPDSAWPALQLPDSSSRPASASQAARARRFMCNRKVIPKAGCLETSFCLWPWLRSPGPPGRLLSRHTQPTIELLQLVSGEAGTTRLLFHTWYVKGPWS